MGIIRLFSLFVFIYFLYDLYQMLAHEFLGQPYPGLSTLIQFIFKLVVALICLIIAARG